MSFVSCSLLVGLHLAVVVLRLLWRLSLAYCFLVAVWCRVGLYLAFLHSCDLKNEVLQSFAVLTIKSVAIFAKFSIHCFEGKHESVLWQAERF